MIKPWTEIERRVLAETRVFDLVAHRRRSEETEREAEFYVLESVDWVNVVALTTERQVVLVEQYRHGVEHVALEIPGGMVDPEDPAPLDAARRELLEETGYASDDWRLIGTVEPNPATHANRCYTFLASDCRRVAEPALDSNEEIDVRVEHVDRVLERLRAGEITHALVVAAFMWWTFAESGERRGESSASRA